MSHDSARCDPWDPGNCEGTPHCPPRCPRFVDREGDRWLVRPFEPGDREALLAMYRDFDPDHRAQGIPPLDERRMERWVDDLLADGCNVVAARDGRVVGHALYTPTDAAEPELAVFVHQDYQGRGIGTELCSHVVATAAAAARDALVLEVEPRNRAAIHVYESVGFRKARGRGDDEPAWRGHSLRMRNPLARRVTVDLQQPPALRA